MMTEITEDPQTRQTLRAGTIVQFNRYPVQLEIDTPVYTSEGTWKLIESEMAVAAAAITPPGAAGQEHSK